jgi:hypothetical protein
MARLIAIDLGAYAVKLTSFTTGTPHELEGVYTQRVPQDETGVPTMVERLASLDLLLRSHPEWSTDPRVCELVWSTAHTAVHRLQLPFTDAAQVNQTLPFAMESEVPFDLEDYVIGWRPIGESGEVFAVIALEDELSQVIEGLSDRTLEPRAVRCGAELLALYAPDEERVTAVVDIGHEHTAICVGRGGQALWFRSLDTAGRSLTRTIQRAMDCSWGEAEVLKHGGEDRSDDEDTLTEAATALDPDATDPAFGVSLPAKAREALNGAISQMLAEVRAALVVAEDELGVGIDEVVLCGGGCRLPEVKVWLEQDLGVPVRDPRDPDGVGVRPEQGMPLAAAWSMARDGRAAMVDLRVGELTYVGGMDTNRAVLTYGGAALGFFLAAVVMMFAFQMRTLSQEQALVDGRIRELVVAADPELAEVTAEMDSTTMVSTMAEMVGEAQEQVDFLGDGSDIPETVDLLYRITRAFPPHPTVTVNVDKFEVNPGSIRIEGLTEGFTQVEAIVNSLRDRGQFEHVTHTTGKVNAKNKLDFVVNIDRTASEDKGDEADGLDEGTSETTEEGS